jgi:hypothetical protein
VFKGGVKVVKNFPSLRGSNFGFLSYVVLNGTHFVWLNMAELRIMAVDQLFDSPRPGFSFALERLGEIGAKVPSLIRREESPMVMNR